MASAVNFCEASWPARSVAAALRRHRDECSLLGAAIGEPGERFGNAAGAGVGRCRIESHDRGERGEADVAIGAAEGTGQRRGFAIRCHQNAQIATLGHCIDRGDRGVRMIVFQRFGQNVVEKLRIGLGNKLGIHRPIARRLFRRFGFPGEHEGSSLVVGILRLELRQRAGELRHPDDPGLGGRDASR